MTTSTPLPSSLAAGTSLTVPMGNEFALGTITPTTTALVAPTGNVGTSGSLGTTVTSSTVVPSRLISVAVGNPTLESKAVHSIGVMLKKT